MTAPEELRSVAADVAGAVGSAVVERRRQGLRWNTKSSVTDLVTEVDTWAEAELVSRLDRLRPDDGFLGEEGTSRPSTSGVTWIVDPIDGTTNLLHDLPGYSVSVAAAVDDVVVAGAVYDAVRAELFSAAQGEGATRNGAPISASSSTELAGTLVGTGFSYEPASRTAQADALAIMLPQVRDVRRLGGAAVDLCCVACGRLDAYYETGLSRWDWAAGALIAAEAGAVVRPGRLTWAAAPGVAGAFADLLDEMGA